MRLGERCACAPSAKFVFMILIRHKTRELTVVREAACFANIGNTGQSPIMSNNKNVPILVLHRNVKFWAIFAKTDL